MTTLEFFGALSNIATAIGVGFAAWQLFTTRKQAATTFEDSLTNQYRTLIERIPVAALFGEKLDPQKQADLLSHFYRYFDLCNEQAFLHKEGRISDETWKNWKDGIISNLGRPAFADAWAQIAARAPGDFDHLRSLCPPLHTPPQQMVPKR
jgi:hypothetical protein